MVEIPNSLRMQPEPYLLNDSIDAEDVAEHLLKADKVVRHKLAESIYAYTHEQDGTYDYNGRMAFVCEKVFGILTALQGDVCILLEDGAGEHLLR